MFEVPQPKVRNPTSGPGKDRSTYDVTLQNASRSWDSTGGGPARRGPEKEAK